MSGMRILLLISYGDCLKKKPHVQIHDASLAEYHSAAYFEPKLIRSDLQAIPFRWAETGQAAEKLVIPAREGVVSISAIAARVIIKLIG